jgi:hypothetical protein
MAPSIHGERGGGGGGGARGAEGESGAVVDDLNINIYSSRDKFIIKDVIL